MFIRCFVGRRLVPEQALDRDDEVDGAVLLDLGRNFPLVHEDEIAPEMSSSISLLYFAATIFA